MTGTDRAILWVAILGFGWGVCVHALDYLLHGWAPYRHGPPALNLFWNALVLLDAAVLALLVRGRARLGLVCGCLLMAVDVAVNAYAAWGLDLPGFDTAVAVQAAFLGFLWAATPLLWPRMR